ncbi:MAG: hypothetical protein ACRCV5_02175 [Afipia sp.]
MKKLMAFKKFVMKYEGPIEVVLSLIAGTTFVFMTFATKTEVRAKGVRQLNAELVTNAKLDALDCKLEDILTKRNPRRECRPNYPNPIPEEE